MCIYDLLDQIARKTWPGCGGYAASLNKYVFGRVFRQTKAKMFDGDCLGFFCIIDPDEF